MHFCLRFCDAMIEKSTREPLMRRRRHVLSEQMSDVYPLIGRLRVSLLRWNTRQWRVNTVFTGQRLPFLFTVSPPDKAPDRNPPSRADCLNMNGHFTWELIRAPWRDSCMTMKSVAAHNPPAPDFQCLHCVPASQRCPRAANQSHRRPFVVLGDVLAR